MRLNRFLARSGLASRRKSEEYILNGRVEVNGTRVMDLSFQVDESKDIVKVDGKTLTIASENHTFVLNKPKSYITSKFDPEGRPLAFDLMPHKDFPSLTYVGRLDFDTTGVLLFTTDGELAHDLLHPKKEVAKRYSIIAAGKIEEDSCSRLSKGIMLDDGLASAFDVEIKEHCSYQNDAGASIFATRLELSISEGRKRIVRRMISALGHRVLELDRIAFAGISYAGLARGEYRELSQDEVKSIREAAGQNA